MQKCLSMTPQRLPSPYTIALANEQRHLRINRRRLMQLARSVLAREEVTSAEISIAIVDDGQIHSINREFLKHDCPTDVISFLLESAECEENVAPISRHTARPTPRIVRRGAGTSIGGEIVISAETASSASPPTSARPPPTNWRFISCTASCICADTMT